MATNNWDFKLAFPVQRIKAFFTRRWKSSLVKLQGWIKKDLVKAMVRGGMGLQGIADTPFYNFISSDQGLSELGIENTEPPKLLDAYERSIDVDISKNTIVLRFGDMAFLKLMTPHPAAGTGNLHIESWLEWIFDDLKVDSGFVPSAKLPSQLKKNIRIKTAPGGLMLPFGRLGSTGSWQFPSRFSDFEKDWLNNNRFKIEDLIKKQMVIFLNGR